MLCRRPSLEGFVFTFSLVAEMAISNSSTSREPAKALKSERIPDVILNLAQQCNVPANQIEDIYPCSPLQHGLFALSTTSTKAYTAQHVLKLGENLDIAHDLRFKEAWNLVIRQHPILRTRIVITSSGAAQVVLRNWIPDWDDCTNLSSYLKTDLGRPLLPGAPLSRFAISRTHLVWTAHHSIYDAQALNIILQDLVLAYHGKPSLPRKPYRSFIRRILDENKNARTRNFWAELLSGKDIVPFPAPPRKNVLRSTKTLQYRATLPRSSTCEVTTATLIQAAWALVLSSRCGSSNVSWGTTLSGRNSNLPGIESIVGPTITTVPICLELDGNYTVAEYLRNTQQTFTRLIPHQHFGLQNIRAISPEAENACNFQTLLAVHPSGPTSSVDSYDGLFRLEEEVAPVEFFNYPLIIQCFLTAQGDFGTAATFNDNVIKSAEVNRLLSQLGHVLHKFTSGNTNQKLQEVDIVSPDDLKQIESWNTSKAISTGFPLDEIQKHIKVRGDADAVCSWDGKLTYEALDKLSSRLAQDLLRRNGRRPEVIIPICFEKSSWMIVAVLATMKAGATFTLLDPKYPQKRLQYIVEFTNARTILASESSKGIFSQCSAEVLVVDEKWSQLQSTENILEAAAPPDMSLNSAMYVVFTSGSTGLPKGVVITHGSYYAGAMGGEMSHIPRYGFGKETRNLLGASPAFDLCVQEILSTLMVGGCICIPSDDDRLSGLSIAIKSLNVNLASLTSSSARQIQPEDVKCLKTLALVGEPLAKDQQQIWADKVCLLNAYGPSECSVVSTIYRGVSQESNTANIGHVVAGAAWIVHPDDHDNLLPIGVTGELLIDGPHVGRGYLKDPEKTAAAFIQNPRWLDPHKYGTRRLYKTGDLVQYDSDGSIIFIGRKDEQTKLRGQRVELGEIEFHLAQLFPHALAANVELFEQDNNQQLVGIMFYDDRLYKSAQTEALLSSISEEALTSTLEIKAKLAGMLPRHMIPSRYQLWRTYPTLPSGKLDRKKIREELRHPSGLAVEVRDPVIQTTSIKSDNAIALRLNKKVVDLLGAKDEEPGSINGQDLQLSGLALDSIQLMSLLNFIRQEFDVKLSIEDLYADDLTFSGLGRLIRSHQTGANNTENVSTENGPDLTREIQKLFDQLLQESGVPSQTVFLTGATGFLGSQILRKLLCHNSVKRVIVHVRAASREKALDRIVFSAKLGKWWDESYLSRLECWLGDFSASKLGLKPHQWRILSGDCEASQRINAIIHNGAAVQWQASYSALRPANVQSTLSLLAAMSQWQYRGSMTFVSGGVKRLPDQDLDSFASILKTANGYSQTKFVSEELVAMFGRSQHNQRHNISIVRPGWIIGTETEGVPNTDDFLWKLVQMCVQINGYPADYPDYWLPVSDVDEVSATVVDSTLRHTSESRGTLDVKDVNNGMLTREFWACIQDVLGPLAPRPMTNDNCLATIIKTLQDAGETHAFRPLLAMVDDGTHFVGIDAPASIREPSERVVRALKRNVESLVEMGYFRGSAAAAAPMSQVGEGAETSLKNGVEAFKRSGLVVR